MSSISVQNEQVGIVDERAAEADLLLHPARQLACGTIAERSEARRVEELLDAHLALLFRESEELRHEVDVVVDAELEVEVLSQALRHVRNARAHVAAVPYGRHIAVQDVDLPLLHPLGPGHQRQKGRLSYAVRADDPHHFTARDLEREMVEGDDLAIAMADVLDDDDGTARCVDGSAHRDACSIGPGRTTFRSSHSGHGVDSSTLT